MSVLPLHSLWRYSKLSFKITFLTIREVAIKCLFQTNAVSSMALVTQLRAVPIETGLLPISAIWYASCGVGLL